MKPYSDYRGLFSSIFLGVFFVILGLIPFVFSHAQTVGEIRDRIDQKSADSISYTSIKNNNNECNQVTKTKVKFNLRKIFRRKIRYETICYPNAKQLNCQKKN